MLMIIFKVTDENEIVGLNPKTLELWRTTVGQEDAIFYRKKMDEEIMPRVYLDEMPNEVIGILAIKNSLTSADTSFS